VTPDPDSPLIERWFALLADKKLRRAAHRSIQALEKDIRDWIWAKTADEILERLNSYLQTNSWRRTLDKHAPPTRKHRPAVTNPRISHVRLTRVNNDTLDTPIHPHLANDAAAPATAAGCRFTLPA
jgi:hypothetical protein